MLFNSVKVKRRSKRRNMNSEEVESAKEFFFALQLWSRRSPHRTDSGRNLGTKIEKTALRLVYAKSKI